jgi:hypothetical protein
MSDLPCDCAEFKLALNDGRITIDPDGRVFYYQYDFEPDVVTVHIINLDTKCPFCKKVLWSD